MELSQFVETTRLEPADIAARTARIHAAALAKSRYLETPNFLRIHPTDLALLFAEYDATFFEGRVARTLGDSPLEFSLSRRMTRAGGKTIWRLDLASGRKRFEICVSVTILYGSFQGDDHRPITVSGLTCRDRLEALQRVMEHEIVHLIEMVVWKGSDCAKARFQSLTRRFFGHTEHTHQMITPRERAIVKFGVRPGQRVRFQYEGREYRGIVNRITRRATVLVEHPGGELYGDGKCYAKFYVSPQALSLDES